MTRKTSVKTRQTKKKSSFSDSRTPFPCGKAWKLH